MMRNRGAEAMMEAMMSGPVPDFLREVAQAVGVSPPPDGTLGELMDDLRVYAHQVDPGAINTYLGHFRGWEVEVQASEDVGHGDLIGTVPIAGTNTPIFAHMGISPLFDRSDPPLERLFSRVAMDRETAIVLHVIPRFFLDASMKDEGRIHSVLFQGGWFLSKDVWHPFLLTDAGPDDLPAQKGILKPGEPSRGLLRDRGQPPEILDAAVGFHKSLRNRLLPAIGSATGVAPAKTAQGEENMVRMMAGSDGWSFFGSDVAMDAHEAMISSLNIPVDFRADEDPLDRAVGGAPEGLHEAVARVAPGPKETEALLSFLADLTNGFEGLNDLICHDLDPEEITSLMDCSTAFVSVSEVAFWLSEVMGWSFVDLNLPSDDGEEDTPVGHGDYIGAIEVEGFEDPVPVMFHGGRIDPTGAASDFAFLTTRRGVTSRLNGLPALVLPASINFRRHPEDMDEPEQGGLRRLLVLAGYAFDGQEWFPVAFGAPGSNPFDNRLSETGALAGHEDCYTGPVQMPGLEGPEQVPSIAFAFTMQQVLDRHHFLGAEIETPRDFGSPTEDFTMAYWGEDWTFFLDALQEEIYARL